MDDPGPLIFPTFDGPSAGASGSGAVLLTTAAGCRTAASAANRKYGSVREGAAPATQRVTRAPSEKIA